ncbi:MAG: IS1595 family transposase [Rhodospirillales bacterium]
MSYLSKPYFHDESAAYAFVEARIWPDGPICPHCGGTDRISKMNGKSTRIGAHKCYQCRKPFTVKIGTIFEQSHVKMHLWLQAIFLMAASKKGISANQLHRTLGVTLKTAWFMSHRIREAMRSGDLSPLGGEGQIVEADETYYGNREERKISEQRRGRPYKKKGGLSMKRAVLGLVERGGQVRTFHIAQATKVNVADLVTKNVDKESILYTDESRLYHGMKDHFKDHDFTTHSKNEYARGPVHSNTIENYFSVFKRGMKGTYQHCAEKHLHRYLAEFDFRYNKRVGLEVTDEQRADYILDGIVGKRLTYETTLRR